MSDLLTQLLSIPNYKVIAAEINEDRITLDIVNTYQDAPCPHCGKMFESLHENHPRTVRDLPISGKPCYLRFIRRRFFVTHADVHSPNPSILSPRDEIIPIATNSGYSTKFERTTSLRWSAPKR